MIIPALTCIAISVIAFIFIFLGLISPQISLFWYRKKRTRIVSTAIYMLSFFVFLGLGGCLLIYEPTDPAFDDPNIGITDSILSKAHHLRDSGMYQQAIYSYTRVINMKLDTTPKRPALKYNLTRAYAGRAIAYAKNKQYELADKDLDKSLKLKNSSYSDDMLMFGKIRFAAKDYKGALIVFNKLLSVDSTSITVYDALCQRAYTKIMLNDASGILADCNKAIKMHPEFGEAFLIRAIATNSCDDYLKAKSLNQDVSLLNTLGCEVK